MGRFSQTRILITGGTSGIGLAGAKMLAAEGADLILTGRSEEKLNECQSLFPDNTLLVRNDSADPATGHALAEAVRKVGGLDGLWLNAGHAEIAPVEKIDAEFFDGLMSANVRGPVLQLAALNGELKPGASVVVTCSTAAYEGGAQASIYAATKGALISLSRCWASALADRDIRVNALIPGAIETGFRNFMLSEVRSNFEADVASRTALKRVGSADEAAAVAVFLLSREAGYVTGAQYVVDGGLTKL